MKSLITEYHGRVLAVLIACGCALACQKEVAYTETVIEICPEGTKAILPDEKLISDINLYVMDSFGLEEHHSFLTAGGGSRVTLRLLKGKTYSFYAYCNAGYDCGHLQGRSIYDIKHYMSYPDSYSHGMPMSGCAENVIVEGGEPVRLHVSHLMSKLSVRIDRSELDKDVDFRAVKLRIGNCPKMVPVWSSGRPDEFFATGFTLNETQLAALNHMTADGISAAVDLYMLENDRSDIAGGKSGVTSAASTGSAAGAEKAADAASAASAALPAGCSFLELEVEYNSDSYHTEGDGVLTYRFYIKEAEGGSIKRGTHYHLCVKPHADGLLCEDSWRLDKSALKTTEPYLRLIPGGTTVDGKWYENYYNLPRGGTLHLDIDKRPSKMALSLREDFVEDDREDGRMEWELDENGEGLRIRSLGLPCSAPMEIHTGPPLNDYILIYVNVD